MRILDKKGDKKYVLGTKEISTEGMSCLSNEIARGILKSLSRESKYPKLLAKELKVHEQNIYYYIRKLEKAGFITFERSSYVNGSYANYYTLSSSSFFFKVDDFEESDYHELLPQTGFLEPFITNGDSTSIIILASPEPHGPQKARGRDAEVASELALFLGSRTKEPSSIKVRLDTDVSLNDLRENNLILIGGPSVNKITARVNHELDVYFHEHKPCICSRITNKQYFGEDIGLICKNENPFNKRKQMLILAGLRSKGTRAAVLALLQHLKKIEEGEEKDKPSFFQVVEGVDLDSDGIIDSVELREN